MQHFILSTIQAVSATVVLWCIWGLICNRMTFRQRTFIIEALQENDYFRDYRRVSYQQHQQALLRFEDPLKLYSKRIQAVALDAGFRRVGLVSWG